MLREAQLDGLVGPTHNYAGLSAGNVASDRHKGLIAHPRAAALQGLAKMRRVRSLGVLQCVLPPNDRPSIATLRRWGFSGSDEEALAWAWRTDRELVRIVTSASSMWTANAATVAPACDASDGKTHIVVANLLAMPHRSLEAPTTERILRAIFSDETRFHVHSALPGGLAMSDEGAANHTRLFTSKGAAHVFAWGRPATPDEHGPKRFVARQTKQASEAVARLLRVDPNRAFFPRQHPAGIDAGGFHTDVLAVGNRSLFLVHEFAFTDVAALEKSLRDVLGDELRVEVATSAELPVKSAIDCYPFNSQLLDVPSGGMHVVAPAESEEDAASHAFFDRLVASGAVEKVHYVDLRQSMQNGGGPACLRLRVPLEEADVAALGARIVADDALFAELEDWVKRHYREAIAPEDLGDPALMRESFAALDDLTKILRIGSVYDFQR